MKNYTNLFLPWKLKLYFPKYGYNNLKLKKSKTPQPTAVSNKGFQSCIAQSV